MAQKVNFSYIIVPSPDNKFGSKMQSGKWSGMIGQLVKRILRIVFIWNCFWFQINVTKTFFNGYKIKHKSAYPPLNFIQHAFNFVDFIVALNVYLTLTWFDLKISNRSERRLFLPQPLSRSTPNRWTWSTSPTPSTSSPTPSCTEGRGSCRELSCSSILSRPW